jgi:hypothetical protein
MSVAFTYVLTGTGWAAATVEIDGNVATITASYLSDALDDLLRAVVNVTRGIPENSFSFLEEPGEYRWDLRRVDEDQLSITITWFDDWQQLRELPGKNVFEGTCRLRTFAGAVYDSCKRLLDRLGPDGYLEKWVNHEFPLNRLHELQRELTRPTERKYF